MIETKNFYFIVSNDDQPSKSQTDSINTTISKIINRRHLIPTKITNTELPFIPIEKDSNALIFFKKFNSDDLLKTLTGAMKNQQQFKNFIFNLQNIKLTEKIMNYLIGAYFYSPNPEFINTEEMITDIKIHEDKEVWEETGHRLVTIQLIIDDLQEI